jgi:hypothetical protein
MLEEGYSLKAMSMTKEIVFQEFQQIALENSLRVPSVHGKNFF